MTTKAGELVGGETRVGIEPGAPLPVRLAVALGLLASLSVPLVLLVTGTGGPTTLVGPAIYVAAAALLLRAVAGTVLGVANTVTLARLVLVSWVAALLPALAPATAAAGTAASSATSAATMAETAAAAAVSSSPAALVAVLVTGGGALLLDGVDGRVARRRGEASEFGARFDSETDAALVLVLSVAVPVAGAAGWWVLAIGLMRYVQLGAAVAVPWLRAPLPPSTARKVVGVAQVVVLLVVLGAPPVVPAVVPAAVLAAALGALAWSFGRDASWQWTARTDLAAGPDLPTAVDDRVRRQPRSVTSDRTA